MPRIELAFHGGMLKIDSMYFGPNEFNPMLPNKVKEFAATSIQYTLHFNNLLKTVGNSKGIKKKPEWQWECNEAVSGNMMLRETTMLLRYASTSHSLFVCVCLFWIACLTIWYWFFVCVSNCFSGQCSTIWYYSSKPNTLTNLKSKNGKYLS